MAKMTAFPAPKSDAHCFRVDVLGRESQDLACGINIVTSCPDRENDRDDDQCYARYDSKRVKQKTKPG
jgi:hypothetical protein